MNDRNETLIGARGVDVHPGVANPTASSTHADPLAANFALDPTTEAHGAGVNSDFEGARQAQRNFAQTAGVCEGRPGIIESTHIDPLNETSNRDDSWANTNRSTGGVGATAGSAYEMAASTASSAASMATGAARLAYGAAVGDETHKRAGKEAIWGKQ